MSWNGNLKWQKKVKSSKYHLNKVSCLSIFYDIREIFRYTLDEFQILITSYYNKAISATKCLTIAPSRTIMYTY